MTFYPGLVLYWAHPMPTGAIVAVRLKSVSVPPGQPTVAVWLVDVMRVETRGREAVRVTEDALYEHELHRMRKTPP